MVVVALCGLGLTVSRAAADPGTVVLQYSCPLPIIGGQPLTATFTWPSALDTVTLDTHTARLPVAVTGSVAAAARTLASLVGAEWIQGTADVTAEVDAPQGDISETMTFTVPRTNVSSGSGPLVVPASGPMPSMFFSQTGTGTVVVSGLVIHLATLTSTGSLTSLGDIDEACTLDSGQSDVVGSFRILPAPTPSPSPSPSPSFLSPLISSSLSPSISPSLSPSISSSSSTSKRAAAKTAVTVPGKPVSTARASASPSSRSRSSGQFKLLGYPVQDYATVFGSILLAVCAAVARSFLKDAAEAVAKFLKRLKPSWGRGASGAGSGRSPDEARLTEAAKCLAEIVQGRIQAEHKQRRLSESGLIPVRWRKGHRQGGDQVRFKNVPGDISATYRKISTGRLVVLGRDGSGKTVLVQRLALELLGDPGKKEYSSAEKPVPVIIDLRSWDPASTLDDWLTGQVRNLLASSGLHAEKAEELVKRQLILGIFEGFDKIPDPRRRAKFLEDLNAVPGMRMVLTSRPGQYLETVKGGQENGVALSKAAIIELSDLPVRDSLSYLLALPYLRSGRPAWQRVADELAQKQPSPAAADLARVLSTPGMVMLARDAYRSRDPSELLTISPSSPQAIEARFRELCSYPYDTTPAS